MCLLIGWRYGGSFAGDVVAHWLKMWRLIGWICGGSFVGYVFAHWLDI